ncbi:MAG TPA: ATP-binding protein [Polyangiaceae bacterium]|nr:ATP-binding protein [Polyangiaceae bacterium]
MSRQHGVDEDGPVSSPGFELPERDLAGALHEVSNALTVVLGWLECAQEEMGASDVAKRAVDIAMSHAKLGRRLARRAIGDDSDVLAEEADLETLVRDVCTGVEREALRRRIALSVNGDPSSRAKLVKGAPGLFQVMTNLLLNAIAMSPEGSTVTVETRARGDEVHLAVIDAGPGVAPSRRGSIFQGGHSSRSGGAGVGLRHAQALATSHGGMLSLGESAAGARFEATWPLVALRPPMARISSMPGLSLEGVRILLLEDDDAVIGLLSTALSLRGANVLAARTPGELQSAFERQRFDAALLDLSPIASDIAGALASVRAHSPAAKMVLISGSAAEVPAAAHELMSAWVRKPFEVGEILAVLRSVRGG